MHTEDLQHVDQNKRIALYKRTDTKSMVWHARFRIEGQTKYKRLSTKRADFDEARRWALNEFPRLEIRINEFDEPITNLNFKDVAQRWLSERDREHQRGDIAKGTYERDRGTTGRYLIPYFGTKSVNKITQKDLDDYWIWRQDYWVSGPGATEQHKKKRTPNSNTIRQENISLRLVLRKAVDLGQLRHETNERFVWKYQSMSKNRRPHFDTADYQKLTNHMRRNEWRKHKHPRIARDRALLREYVLIMANSGMRVGEQRNLKWKDVQWRKDNNRNDMLVCAVEGKTGKRLVVCNEGMGKYFDRVKQITCHTEPDDWVWAKKDGTLKEDFSVGFKSLITDVFGSDDERTLYSLRHTYATFKIIRENMNLKFLSTQMGTSVAMIDKHYGHVEVSEIGGEIAKKSVGKKSTANTDQA